MILYVILAIILGGPVLFWTYRMFVRERLVVPRIANSVFLEVLMPREITATDKEKEPQKEEKDMISVAEQLFATLAHTEKRNFSTFLRGQQSFAFEIISQDKKISFVINCPKRFRDLVEKQVQAQYPHADIEQILPPRIISKGNKIAAAELGLQKKYFFPVKTYKVMESDPLSALANSLSKLGSDEGGAIQLVISPAPLGWRARVIKRAREIQRGRRPDVHEIGIMRAANVIFSALGDFLGALSSSRNKKEEEMYKAKNATGEPRGGPLTPMQQEAVKRLEEKASKAGFEVNLRVVVTSPTVDLAQSHLRNMLSSFMQYSQPPFNGFRIRRRSAEKVAKDFIVRRFDSRLWRRMILNAEECASIFHLPTKFTQTPNLKWLSAKRAPAPVNVPTAGRLLGINTYRGVKTEILIDRDDRRRHLYIVGRTGTGKSEFMKGLARQDIEAGEGVAIIDPHGDLIEDILQFVPKARAEDVILFEPFDVERPLGLNMLEVKNEEEKDFVIQEMISIFYKLVTDPAMIGPMFEHNMRNAMLTLMADPTEPGTIVEIPRIFTDPDFQRYKLSKVKDPIVRSFWEKEMAKTSDFHKSEMLGYLISKVGRFVENEMVRNIIGQTKSAFDFREVMDEGKILLVNLAKGKTGEINSKLLGLIIVSKLQMAALSRASLPERERKDFYVYIDEFQNFVTDSIATILSEARKYRLNLIIAHQYLGQLVQQAGIQGAAATNLKDAVFGNAGTIVSFRIGVEDAETLAKEFAPVFNEYDVINIDRFNAYLKLMINGAVSRPFNMQTLPPPEGGQPEIAKAIRELSRLKYGRPRAEMVAEILQRSRLGESAPRVAGIERSL